MNLEEILKNINDLSIQDLRDLAGFCYALARAQEIDKKEMK